MSTAHGPDNPTVPNLLGQLNSVADTSGVVVPRRCREGRKDLYSHSGYITRLLTASVTKLKTCRIGFGTQKLCQAAMRTPASDRNQNSRFLSTILTRPKKIIIPQSSHSSTSESGWARFIAFFQKIISSVELCVS